MDALTGSAAGAQVRTVDAGRGVAWWSEAWALFMKAAGLWIVLAIVLIIIFVVLSFIPILGGLALALVLPVFVGSWMLAARKVEQGGTLEVGDLFSCFQGERLTPLLILGALVLAAGIVIGIVVGALGMGAVFGGVASGMAGSGGGLMASLGAGMLALLAGLVLGLLLTMATWFAPALVVFDGVAPVDAVKASFAASLKNIGAFIVWSLLYLVAAFVASIPFGLGWIVLAPLVLLTAYIAYKDIFGATPAT
ncbi:MAG: hypothetical protein IPM15_06090 [Betaproteobacteria bacterium]|nr:hypothetical protein [Betaproteobacteria bacterium]MCC6249785.1 hypothetical protein [Rubrivivax sp.]